MSTETENLSIEERKQQAQKLSQAAVKSNNPTFVLYGAGLIQQGIDNTESGEVKAHIRVIGDKVQVIPEGELDKYRERGFYQPHERGLMAHHPALETFTENGADAGITAWANMIKTLAATPQYDGKLSLNDLVNGIDAQGVKGLHRLGHIHPQILETLLSPYRKNPDDPTSDYIFNSELSENINTKFDVSKPEDLNLLISRLNIFVLHRAGVESGAVKPADVMVTAAQINGENRKQAHESFAVDASIVEMTSYVTAINNAGTDVAGGWFAPDKLTADDISITDPEFHEGNARYVNALIAGDVDGHPSIKDVCENMEEIFKKMKSSEYSELASRFENLAAKIDAHYGWTVHDEHYDEKDPTSHEYYTDEKAAIIQEYLDILQSPEYAKLSQDYLEKKPLADPGTQGKYAAIGRKVQDDSLFLKQEAQAELIKQARRMNEVVIPYEKLDSKEQELKDFLKTYSDLPDVLKDDLKSAELNDPAFLYALAVLPENRQDEFEKIAGVSFNKAGELLNAQMSTGDRLQMPYIDQYKAMVSFAENINELVSSKAFAGQPLADLKSILLPVDRSKSYQDRVSDLYENPSYLEAFLTIKDKALNGDAAALQLYQQGFENDMLPLWEANARLYKELRVDAFKLEGDRQNEVLNFCYMVDAIKAADENNPALSIHDINSKAAIMNSDDSVTINSGAKDIHLAFMGIQNRMSKLLTIEPENHGNYQFSENMSIRHDRKDILDLVKKVSGPEAEAQLREIMGKKDHTHDDLHKGMQIILRTYEKISAFPEDKFETPEVKNKFLNEYNHFKALYEPLVLYSHQSESVKKDIDKGLREIKSSRTVPEASASEPAGLRSQRVDNTRTAFRECLEEAAAADAKCEASRTPPSPK